MPDVQPPEEYVRLLADLVAIDSTNPDLVPDGAGELAVAEYVEQWLGSHGIKAVVDEFQPTRANVVATVDGPGEGKLLFNAHMDTVGVIGMEDPLVPTVRDGRLYGRGSADTKAGLAGAMWATREAHRGGWPGGTLVFAGVADEEAGSLGTERLIAAGHAEVDAVVVIEPTAESLINCHKGQIWLQIDVTGHAAHGSSFAEGVDAIAKAGLILAAVDRHARDLVSGPGHPVLGPGSIHASTIRGGQEISSYPDRCTIRLERRSVPGDTPDTVVAELQALIDEVAAADPAVKATVHATFWRSSLDQPPDLPIVTLVGDAYEGVVGKRPSIAGAAGWTDSALHFDDGKPSVVFGPNGAGAHGMVEWVDLASAWRATQTLVAVTQRFAAG